MNRSALSVARDTLWPGEEILYLSETSVIYYLVYASPFIFCACFLYFTTNYDNDFFDSMMHIINDYSIIYRDPSLFWISAIIIWSIVNFISGVWKGRINSVCITNRRLIHNSPREGLIDLGLDRILGHKVSQDAFGRLFGYASVSIVGAGIGELRLSDYMKNVDRFRNALTGKIDYTSKTFEGDSEENSDE